MARLAAAGSPGPDVPRTDTGWIFESADGLFSQAAARSTIRHERGKTGIDREGFRLFLSGEIGCEKLVGYCESRRRENRVSSRQIFKF